MVEFLKRGLFPQSPARSPLGCSSCSPRVFFNLEGRCDSLFSAPQPHSRTQNTKRKLSVYVCISNQQARTKDFQRTGSNSPHSHFLVVFFLSLSLSCVQLSATPWTVACQAPLSMGFCRQEYWRGLPFPSPADLPDPVFPALAGGLFTAEPPGKPQYSFWVTKRKKKKTVFPCLEIHLGVWKRSVKG